MLEILVVDDHPLMRAGLQCMLDTAPDLAVVGAAADGAEALRLAVDLEPDVVLMDLSMPGMGGLEATRHMVRLRPAPKVVVLTTTCAAVTVREAFAAGAVGYLLKDMPPAALITALRGLREQRPAVDPRVERILVRQRQAGRDGSTSVPTARSH